MREPRLHRCGVAVLALVAWVVAREDRHTMLDGLAVLLVLLSASECWAATRIDSSGRAAALLRGLGPAAGGAALLVGGSTSETSRLAVAVGVVLLVRSLGDVVGSLTIGAGEHLRAWLGALCLGELGLGLATSLTPALFGQAGIVTGGAVWLAGGVTGLLAPGVRDNSRLTTAPTARIGELSAQERARITDEVYLAGEDLRARLVRFAVLLALSTVIATYGVLSNSVASVIGAMIVAPLSLPIQSLAVALVAGAARQARTAAAVLAAGVLAVLTISMFIAATFRDLGVVLELDQVTARTAPALPDLAVALAAGAAGGFALLRRDVAGALPGVAIAVSLVPPLCVSGASLADGRQADATGAFLLFAINFVAIVLAVGAVLVLGGFGATGVGAARRLTVAGVAFAVAAAVLAVPLALTGLDTLRQEAVQDAVRVALADYLDEVQPAEVLGIQVDGARVELFVASSQEPPDPANLEAAVRASVGSEVDITVHWLAAQELASS